MTIIVSSPSDSELEAEIASWVDSAQWPDPEWLVHQKGGSRTQSYEAYVAHQLRSRYAQLAADFRGLVHNFAKSGVFDVHTARECFVQLQRARPLLENKGPDAWAASDILDMVERYQIWISPPQLLIGMMPSLHDKIDDLDSSQHETYRQQCDAFSKLESRELWKNSFAFGQLRGLFDAVYGTWNRQVARRRIGDALQIRRLHWLFFWGLPLLVVFWAATPLMVASDIGSPAAKNLSGWWMPWVPGFAIGLIGALGGFLSGLLQAKSSTIDLAEYKESLAKLSLQPLIGATVALVIFILLSWQVLPGVKVENWGTYLLFAFLSGFSERYFLRLLRVDREEHASGRPPAVPVAFHKPENSSPPKSK